MNNKRAVIAAIILWIASFVVGLAFVGVTGISDSGSIVLAIFGLASIIILTALMAEFYFKGKNTARTEPEGLRLGIVFLLVSLLLDMTVFIPFVALGGSVSDIVAYYASAQFLAGAVLVVLTTTLIGKFTGKPAARRRKRR